MKIYRKFLLKILDIAGINAVFRFLNRNKAIILWYHGICDDSFKLLSGYDERHIQKSKFREQLNFLKQKGYVFYNMSELIDVFKSKKKIKKIAVLTFDDGFSNVVKNAYPVMKEFNSKGCFYLISSLIGRDELLWTDFIETVVRNSKKGKFEFIFKGDKIVYNLIDKESYENVMQDIKFKLRTLPDEERIEHIKQFDKKKLTDIPKEFFFANWNQIRNLNRDVLEIGAHTKNHPNLTSINSSKNLELEIKDSKDEIEKKIGYEVNHFCYPAGDYNDRIIKKIKDSGFKSAVTIIHGFNDENTNVYLLKRIECKENFLEFKSLISGSFLALYRVKEIFFRKK